MSESVTFDKLSAYVDGELDAAEAARLAMLAARDPSVAQAIARLQSLRAAIADSVPPPVQLLVPDMPSPFPPRRLPDLKRVAAAAGLALALLAGGYWFIDRTRTPRTMTDLAAAVALHDRWLETALPPLRPKPTSAAPADRLLSATGLRLVLKERVELEEGMLALHSRFVGERGCRMSLFEFGAGLRDDATNALDIHQKGALHVARWQSGRTMFIVVARDMDPVRFATIAGSLRTLGPALSEPAMDDLIASLSTARQPCRA
ncbi:anti-sigma factor [Mesorhizobium sp. L-8-10]|uniref:hypothetical protein n=1 Tax=unclassified Mesorhizobium TaxID=325217 RepID=UPI001925D95F|nr:MULTISPECIES: hypothetical protein [unclassified Mesorhizobium]BCH24580.1 anti-sigma factor [Mesorhizobium sp. L-8-3]BCH32303.1 anti-sigma factor [Mesorhizobium sp. L-8-10]